MEQLSELQHNGQERMHAHLSPLSRPLLFATCRSRGDTLPADQIRPPRPVATHTASSPPQTTPVPDGPSPSAPPFRAPSSPFPSLPHATCATTTALSPLSRSTGLLQKPRHGPLGAHTPPLRHSRGSLRVNRPVHSPSAPSASATTRPASSAIALRAQAQGRGDERLAVCRPRWRRARAWRGHAATRRWHGTRGRGRRRGREARACGAGVAGTRRSRRGTRVGRGGGGRGERRGSTRLLEYGRRESGREGRAKGLWAGDGGGRRRRREVGGWAGIGGFGRWDLEVNEAAGDGDGLPCSMRPPTDGWTMVTKRAR